MTQVNLVSLKPDPKGGPLFFDDTLIAVGSLLQRAGYRVHTSCNVVYPDVHNILWGAGTQLFPDLAAVRAVGRPEFTCIFNMEQLASDSPLVTTAYLDFLHEYRVLDYNARNLAVLLERRADQKCSEFPVLPCAELAACAQPPQACANAGALQDVGFFGALTERRVRVLDALRARGVRVKQIQGFGENLSSAMADCRLILNVHAYDTGIFEIARALRPCALGIPMVSEQSCLPLHADWSASGICFAAYDDLVGRVTTLLDQPDLQLLATRQTQAFLGGHDWRTSALSAMQEAGLPLPTRAEAA